MGFHFGVDYYPEHWPEERWETDAKLMREMGIRAVRMAEFAWSRLEPEEGNYDFAWLDRAIALLGEYGIETILGTPTAAPPAWMIEKEPEILPMDGLGMRKGFGGRHHDCQSNPAYRERIRSLVTAMAEHYKDQKFVIGWQIDNELGNSHEELCMCPSCHRAFGEWLRRKYKTIENLNSAWGTVFWSQEYRSFSQVPVPKAAPTAHNPSLLLNYKQFCSDLVIDFLELQAGILRKICKGWLITHNLMGFYDKTDYFKLGEHLDIAANDQYPTGYYFEQPGQPDYEVAACYDLIRSIKKNPFWMMEMQAGATGGDILGRTPGAGRLRLWTYQAVAHGADAIVYFRWRTCLFGTEQYWHGILPHSGIAGRSYEELRETAAELEPVMEDMEGRCARAQVGIVFSYDQSWAFRIQPGHPELSYTKTIQNFYRACYEKNIAVDFVGENEPLKHYSIIFAPLQYLSDEKQEQKYIDYVERGGHLVLTMRTGVKNRDNVCEAHILPGRFKHIAGIAVSEYDCLLQASVSLKDGRGQLMGHGRLWADKLALQGAEALFYYGNGMYAGEPAVTCHTYGMGKVYYLGCQPEQRLLTELLQGWMKEAGVKGTGWTAEGVEAVYRPGREKEYLFVLNHTEERKPLKLTEGWKLRLTDKQKNVQDENGINGLEARIYEREGTNR